MTYEAQNETQAHVLAVIATAMPIFDDRLPDNERAALSAYLHALNTHLQFAHGQQLWKDEETYKGVIGVAFIIGEDIRHTWDGDNYDWEQGVERFMRRLDIKW